MSDVITDIATNSSSKTMLITGGSRGIGAAVAELAASRGYSIAISYHSNKQAADQVCEKIINAGGAAFAVQADVSRPADIEALFNACDQRWSALDVLINNAGIVDRSTRLDAFDADRISHILQVNVSGAMLCAKEAVKRMSTAHGGQGGSIVNVSSVAALRGSPNEYVDYAASKAAVDTMTVGLSQEVAQEGIRVNAVRPGIIDTEIHASGGEPDRISRIAPTVPMQRAGTAMEVAYAILWLASAEASYVTGSFLNVSGGR